MTRKHFEALAAALKDSKPDGNGEVVHPIALTQWRADVRAIALVCHAYNHQFSTRRFYDACGYESE